MADAPALATVAQFAAYVGEPIDPNDQAVALYLQLGTAAVRNYLNSQVTQVLGDVALCDPINGSYVVLDQLPVTNVALVETYSTWAGAWTTMDPSTYTVSRRLGIIAALPSCGTWWPSTPESWRVTYDHGWVAVPDAILGAVLGYAARGWASEPGVTMERIGGYNVRYDAKDVAFSPAELSAMRPYMNPTIA